MFNKTLIALALTVGLTTAATAQQDNINVSPNGDVRSTSVDIAGLNLASAEGKAALNARLAEAVKHVCTFGASRFNVDTACAQDARRDASAQVAAMADGRLAQSAVVVHGAQ